jgi:uncharacterized coiled-coil protein SlyX
MAERIEEMKNKIERVEDYTARLNTSIIESLTTIAKIIKALQLLTK